MKATIICNIQISLAFHKQITYFINFFACIIFCKSKVMNWLASSSRVNFAIFQWFLYPWIWHSVKSAQIRSYFWPVFSCNRTRNNSVFGHFSRSVKVWNFTQWFLQKFASKLILEEIHKLTSKSEKNEYPPSPKLLNKIPKLCCLTLKWKCELNKVSKFQWLNLLFLFAYEHWAKLG